MPGMFVVDLTENTQQNEGQPWIESLEFDIDFQNLGYFAKIQQFDEVFPLNITITFQHERSAFLEVLISEVVKVAQLIGDIFVKQLFETDFLQCKISRLLDGIITSCRILHAVFQIASFQQQHKFSIILVSFEQTHLFLIAIMFALQGRLKKTVQICIVILLKMNEEDVVVASTFSK